MKKSQRQRLAALLAKAEADRSEAEKTELTSLQALASQHPDPAADIDDPAEAPTAAKPAAKRGLREVLAGALQGARDPESTAATLIAAREQVTTITAERDQARQARDTANTQLGAVCGFLGIEIKTLAGKDADATREHVAAVVRANALDLIAGMGMDAGTLPVASKSTSSTTASGDQIEDLRAQLAECKDPAAKGKLTRQLKALRTAAAKAADQAN